MLNYAITKKVIYGSIILLIMSVDLYLCQEVVWNSTDEWTPCSTQCGDGEERQIFKCLKKTLYKTNEWVLPGNCSKIQPPINTRICSMGPCPTLLNDSFVWVVGNWTQCSKPCGKLATQSREVACFLMTHTGQLLISKLSQCDSKIEPNRFITCAETDCHPNFLTSKWGKCPDSVNCGKSVRRRKVECVSVLKEGKLKIISASVCYGMKLPPPKMWEICTPNNDKSCHNFTDINRYNLIEVKIDKDESEVYQMRSSKKLRLKVGQTAAIFTSTKLSIECPVIEFPQSFIRWSHNDKMFTYNGESTDRVRVNQRGILVIKEFLLTDSGVWKCHAGKSLAEVTLKHELPSNGFHNWLKRHSNHNYGMFNEESNEVFIIPDSMVWMKGDWSKCSVSCGTDDDELGFQVRKVTCEKVEAKYYKISHDKYCPSNKPISKRRCKSTTSCPLWRVEEDRNERCTDHCINIDLANKNTNIYCEYEMRTVDSSYCDPLERPKSTCVNNKCKLEYVYGSWSQCSLSCSNSTQVSIQSRTMQCLWKHDGTSAYNLCQYYNIVHQPLTRPCNVPKCILGCHDLTPTCTKQSKYRCRSSLFYHFCCAFCRLQTFY